jgi:hypothetical protein
MKNFSLNVIYKIYALLMKILKLFIPTELYRRIEFKCRRISPQISYQPIKNPKIIMTLYSKNEVDIIEQNILFHKAQGIDAFIASDVSTDGTREIYEKYKNKGWVLEIMDQVGDLDQKYWVDKMILTAREKYGADWIINADIDEFWYCKNGSIKDELSKISENKIFVYLQNIICEDLNNVLANTKKVVRHFPKKVEADLIAQNKLSRFSQFTPSVKKVIHRSQDYLTIHSGNHDVDMFSNWSDKVSSSIVICHYNIRGLEHFKRKTLAVFENMLRSEKRENERNIFSKKFTADIGRHVKYLYEGAQNGRLNLDDEYYKAIGKFCAKEIEKYGLVENDDTVIKFFKNNPINTQTDVK